MADDMHNKGIEGGGDTISFEEALKPKQEFGKFLEDKTIYVRPVVRETKWQGLLERTRRDAFMYNSSKRTFCLPISSRSGQLVPILDDSKAVKTPQFPEPVTEKQFFEKLLHKDLNFYAPKATNFWLNDKLGKITIRKEGLELNLNDPIDAIKYRILKANKAQIAPDKESARNVPTYEFYLEDSKEKQDMEAEFANRKMYAFNLFAKMQEDQFKLAAVLKVAGKGVVSKATLSWLKGQVYKFLEEDPNRFILTVEDPLFEDKAFILDAVKAGALLRKGRDEYALDTGTIIGNINAAVTWFNKPENSAMYNIVRERVERSRA